MVFCKPTPQADRWGQPHTAKPDLDNVAKMVCDCMERAGALPRGDSRVSMGEMSKVWAERGGVYVTMRPATTSRPMPTTAPAPSWLASDTASGGQGARFVACMRSAERRVGKEGVGT